MKAKFGWLAVIALAVCVTGCKSPEERAKEEQEKKAEFDKLNGRWRGERTGDTEEGEEPDAEATKGGIFYVIENEQLKTVYVGKDGKEEVFNRQLFRLAGGKDVKQVDLVACDDAGKPITTRTTKKGITGKRKTTTSEIKDQAVYKVEGDTLTICASYDDKRPTDFNAPRGSMRHVLKLERVKDGSKPAEPKKDDTKKEEPKKDEKKDK